MTGSRARVPGDGPVMPRALRSLLVFGLALGAAALCRAEWFTLNDASDQPDQVVQVDPTSITADGRTRTIRLRVDGTIPRRASSGIMFRSFDGTVSIDCITRSARYDSFSLYGRSQFAGAPVYARRFGPTEARPAAFGTLRPEFAERVIRAACRVEAGESNAAVN